MRPKVHKVDCPGQQVHLYLRFVRRTMTQLSMASMLDRPFGEKL